MDDWIVYGLVKDHLANMLIDAGKVSIASNCIEFKEVHFLCAIQDAFKTHSVQARSVGRPCKDRVDP